MSKTVFDILTENVQNIVISRRTIIANLGQMKEGVGDLRDVIEQNPTNLNPFYDIREIHNQMERFTNRIDATKTTCAQISRILNNISQRLEPNNRQSNFQVPIFPLTAEVPIELTNELRALIKARRYYEAKNMVRMQILKYPHQAGTIEQEILPKIERIEAWDTQIQDAFTELSLQGSYDIGFKVIREIAQQPQDLKELLPDSMINKILQFNRIIGDRYDFGRAQFNQLIPFTTMLIDETKLDVATQYLTKLRVIALSFGYIEILTIIDSRLITISKIGTLMNVCQSRDQIPLIEIYQTLQMKPQELLSLITDNQQVLYHIRIEGDRLLIDHSAVKPDFRIKLETEYITNHMKIS